MDRADETSELGVPSSWGVSAGRSLLPKTWPDGAQFAVALSFDLDHETPWEDHLPISPCVLSAAEYGTRVGLPRILRLLEGSNVRATFFVPAIACERYQAEMSDLVERGHEIALHGYRHERNFVLSESEERKLFEKSIEIFRRLFGRSPRGYRAPSFDPSVLTAQLLIEHGLQYDSSLMADDSPYELLFQGIASGLVEIPVEWTRDDATYFLIDRWSLLRPTGGVRGVGEFWRDDWQQARVEGGVFQLTLHPDLIGHRSRIGLLEGLLTQLASDGTCWFATHEEVATYCTKGESRDNN